MQSLQASQLPYQIKLIWSILALYFHKKHPNTVKNVLYTVGYSGQRNDYTNLFKLWIIVTYTVTETLKLVFAPTPLEGGGIIYSTGSFVQTILTDRYIRRREL